MKLLLPILLLFNLAAYAVEGDSISAYVSAEQVKRNQPFEAGIKYTGTHSYTIAIKEIDGLKVFSGPNTSSQYSIVNGVTTSSGSVYYRVLGTVPNKYEIQIEVKERDKLMNVYTLNLEVLNDEWTKQDELQQAQSDANDPFNDDFFKDFKAQDGIADYLPPRENPKHNKRMYKADLAKLESIQPQFAQYDGVVGKAITLRYVVRFNAVKEEGSNIDEMYLRRLPKAKNVYVEMMGNSDLSGGSRNDAEQAQQISIAAICQRPGKYTLSPLVISYNGKRYKTAKVVINTTYKGEAIEI